MILTNNIKKYKIKIIFTVVLIATLTIGVAFYYQKSTQKSTVPQESINPIKPEINYGPPTEEEKQAANNVKEQVLQKEEAQNNKETQTGLKKVTPIITYASTVEVNAYVQDVFEDNGECVATFTQGATIITRKVQGFTNVSNTQCAPILPGLPNNEPWTVFITYNSKTSNGDSDKIEVKQ